MGKRKLVALLNLSSRCLVMVEWLFLAAPWGCLRFVIVVFPDHTHLLFLNTLVLKVKSQLSLAKYHQMQTFNINDTSNMSRQKYVKNNNMFYK